MQIASCSSGSVAKGWCDQCMCSNVDIKLIIVQIVNPFILCVYLFIHVALSHLMQNEFGDTALIAASYQGHIECATVLLKHRADVNYQNKVRLLYAGSTWFNVL